MYLHDNNITSIPYLKVVGHDHVLQEFSRSHYKRKIDKRKSTSGDTKKKLNELNTQLDGKAPVNISANGKTGENLDVHKTNMLRNSFILEEDEELLNTNANLITTNKLQLTQCVITPFKYDSVLLKLFMSLYHLSYKNFLLVLNVFLILYQVTLIHIFQI